MPTTLGEPGGRRFSKPTRLPQPREHAARDGGGRPVVPGAVGGRRLADQGGEAGAERAQRGATHPEAGLGDADVTAAQQRLGPLDPAGHEIAVRGFAVRGPEAAAEVTGRHVRRPGQRGHVERLGVVAVHPVAGPAQQAQLGHRAALARARRTVHHHHVTCHTATIARRLTLDQVEAAGFPDVESDDMYGIGEIARASGLSISALRFYDGAGVLVPAEVDPATGYRRYSDDQLRAARLVAGLRRVGMPVAEITRAVAELTNPPAVRKLLDE